MAERQQKNVKGALLTGNVTDSLRKMSVPMLLGMVAMILVNLIDTYWISRLGTEALAAISFAFPVQSFVINISLGLMVGTSVVVAQAVGGGHAEEAKQITTDASVLAVIVVLLVSALGLIFQEQLFRMLGAEGEILDGVMTYMTPWFVGIAFLVVPMIANGALRATGDAKTPMRVMMLGAALNAILDPMFIFGFGPIPALGLQGAAIATVIARFIGMLVVFYVLIVKTKLLSFSLSPWKLMKKSWVRLSRVAVPAIVTNAVGPLSIAVLTGMVAAHGPDALAAWGIGARVDAVLLLVPFALSGAVSPFVGQNYGAHLRARVAEGLNKSLIFALGWGVLSATAVMLSATWLADLFSEQASVQSHMMTYLRVIPVGYAFIGVVAICSSAFNAVDRAVRSSVLSILRSLIIAIPAAYIGNNVAGLHGLFLGLVIASSISATLGVLWMRQLLFPYGRVDKSLGDSLSLEQVKAWLHAAKEWSELSSLIEPIVQSDGLSVHTVRGGALGLHVGAIEIAHLEPNGIMDLPFPVEVGDNLVRLGVFKHHPIMDNNGWYRFEIGVTGQAKEAVWILGLAHLLYALSERGEDDPITKEEMDMYTISPKCVEAMRKAAERWNAIAEVA